jgi:exodeoxyribonuclease-3
MRIATYNAASVRARLPRLTEWLDANEPDVLAIQETKVEDDKFPREEFEARGYEIAIHGQKSWNGVAILSRLPIDAVSRGLEDDLLVDDRRLIAATIGGIRFINTYVPNGNAVGNEKWQFKMAWLETFRQYLRQRFRPEDPVIWLGDINIARHPQDVYNSAKVLGGVGHHPDEFSRLDAILDFGLTDAWRHLHPETMEFTFWDFTVPRAVDRKQGWRIDHVYVTEPLLGRVEAASIDVEARRQEKPSDHTFVTVALRD